MKRGVRGRRRLTGLDPLNWSLFAVLVVSLFFKRVMDIWGAVTPRDCDEVAVNFLGPTPALDGPFEVFLVIGLAAAALLFVQVLDSLLARRATLAFGLLWAVNLALAGLLVWSFALTWAWLNPGAPAARPIFRIATALQPPLDYWRLPPVNEREPANEGDWIWDEATRTWTNQPLGLIRRYEVVRFCNQPERVRAQLKLIYGERIEDGRLIEELDADYLEAPRKGYVLYDLENNYLVTPGGPYVQTSTLTRQRDAAYDPDKAAMSPEEAERRYFEWIDSLYVPQRARDPDFPRIPKDEIDRIVAESWGDERPSWHDND
ncbi:MAG: hypothetical protein RIB03_00140 [Henriciella sp.]|uniref:hypothetical protein n=1 Tax=Henriciella sp. TaxID=1968823 RepID=UPI0032EB21D1